jgi:hypothetical protein
MKRLAEDDKGGRFHVTMKLTSNRGRKTIYADVSRNHGCADA